jgi:hypothetical protein
MKKTIQVPAILSGVTTKVDKSLSLRFSTNEMSSEDVANLIDHQGEFGYLLFKPNQFSNDEVPKEEAADGSKSYSERLRSVMYLVWENKGSKESYESYRSQQMEHIIKCYKNKLPPRI